MVGFDPKQTTLNGQELAYVVFSTSALTRALCQPFDVVKIRFQVQYEPIEKSSSISKYKSIRQCVRSIVREEGLRALWKGHLTGQFLSGVYNYVQFTAFHNLTVYSRLLVPSFHDDPTKRAAVHLVCGALSAVFTVLTVQPIDLVRTRLVTQGEPKVGHLVIRFI